MLQDASAHSDYNVIATALCTKSCISVLQILLLHLILIDGATAWTGADGKRWRRFIVHSAPLACPPSCPAYLNCMLKVAMYCVALHALWVLFLKSLRMRHTLALVATEAI